MHTHTHTHTLQPKFDDWKKMVDFGESCWAMDGLVCSLGGDDYPFAAAPE